LRIVLAALLALLFIAPASAAPAFSSADAAQLAGAFESAWNHADISALGSLFTPDAQFMNGAGVLWDGRTEIMRQHAWLFGTVPKSMYHDLAAADYGELRGSKVTMMITHQHALRPGVEVAYATWTIHLGKITGHGVLGFVLTQENGAWRIAAAQNADVK
jgi:uncharacterized protein (TIGR02246 family)